MYLFSISSGALTYWKSVDQVPAELLREEVGDSTAEHNLGELSRVTERIWKPELARATQAYAYL